MRSPVLLLAVGLHLVAGDCGNCKFPFTFNGRLHKTCTTLDGDPKMWCSTKTDGAGNHEQGNWEYCTDPSCPGVTNDPMEVDPRNAVGSCVCGVPNTPQNRETRNGHKIVGGRDAGVGEFPWQVALLFGNTLADQGCGGTLISDQHVLTAAHCTEGSSPSDIKVAIGDTSLATPDEVESFIVDVASIDIHEEYGGPTGGIENDISIMTLSAPVDLKSHPNIKPACLPSSGADFANADSTVSGWGTLEAGGNQVAWLNEVGVTTFAYGDCGSMNSQMTEDMLCSGAKQGGKDSCQGDSGGPLVSADPGNGGAHSVIGVVSWGYGCADSDSLGIYANVSHFSDWIASRIAGSGTCDPPSGSPPSSSTGSPGSTATAAPATTTSDSPMTTPPATDCYEEGMKPFLKEVTKSGTKTPEECQAKCQNTPYCEYFRWKKWRSGKGGKCSLLMVSYKSNANSGSFTSGPRDC